MTARATRLFLSTASPCYGSAVAVRNAAFDRGLRRVYRVDRPVISVGNITTGGTGKTPIVAWLVNWAQQHDLTPAIVSRGYHSLDGEANDEKLLLDEMCPGMPHVQNPDRVAACRQVIDETGCDVIILDDGFQHRRLGRDFDLVLIDVTNPWGFGHLLPRGLLRESPFALRRADHVLLTRCEQATQDRIDELRREIARYTSVPIAESRFVATQLRSSTGETLPLAELQGDPLLACCAIGNPAAFGRTLTAAGLSCPDDRLIRYPDHHHYTDEDVATLEEQLQQAGATALITTGKDLVKLGPLWNGPARLFALELSAEIVDATGSLERALARIIRRFLLPCTRQ